jgi:hypothetical protein
MAEILWRKNAVPQSVIFASPAEVELAPDPIPAHWVVEGEPQVHTARLATSTDGTSSVMVWSCTAGRFYWHYLVDETLHLISGEVFVTDENNQVRRLGPGDMAFFPAGSRSLWHVPHRVRKLAVCRHAMPRACGYGLRLWNYLVDVMTGFSTTEAEPPQPADRVRASARRATAA